jgi:uncharacterized protein (DUF362 family)
MNIAPSVTRRRFICASFHASAAAIAAFHVGLARTRASVPFTSRVALTRGNDRADNAFRALQFSKREIAAAIGRRRIILKPNMVEPDIPLCASHVDWLEGILEFLKSIGRTEVIIAEATANGGTRAAYDNYGYFKLTRRYAVKLMDLNQEGFSRVQIWNGSTLRAIRVANMLRDPNSFVISAPRLKTHNNAVATLGVKNVAMAAPTVDVGRYFSQPSNVNDKPAMHGSNNQDLNDNMYRLAKVYGIHPHLSVLDGYQGMQGNGPTSGYAAPDQKMGVASLDWVAADRVGVALMGLDTRYPGQGTVSNPDNPAYLNYCCQAGLGEWDLSKIQLLGEPLAGNIVNYVPHANINQMLNLRRTP